MDMDYDLRIFTNQLINETDYNEEYGSLIDYIKYLEENIEIVKKNINTLQNNILMVCDNVEEMRKGDIAYCLMEAVRGQ